MHNRVFTRKKVLFGMIAILVSAGLCAAVLWLQGAEVDIYVIAAEDTGSLDSDPAVSLKPPIDEAAITPSIIKSDTEPESAGTPKPEEPTGAVLGEYTTKFSGSYKARVHNIHLASEAINDSIVQPGEVFSYNETLGPTTQANGYQKARTFRNGQKTFGFGGGVCQVSSTLYNAVDEAGLKVKERHKHSLPVAYVPKGRDAATSYGSVDFKFVNTQSYPVKIVSEVIDNTIHVSIKKA